MDSVPAFTCGLQVSELPILYKEARTGKLHSWKIWTEGADIVEEYGTVDGEKTINRRTAKAKNVGKANATTPEEQAVKEAEAKHRKKLEKDYSTTKKGAKEVVFLPMLAHDFRKMKKELKFPVDVQPKLDGVRCLAYWEGDELKLMSRGGKEYNVPHIQEEVAEFLPPGSVLDGELYVHGLALQDITALVKKHREPDHPDYPGGSEKLVFFVFDGFHVDCTHHTWSRRKEDLTRLIESKEAGSVGLLPTKVAKNKTELESLLNKYEAGGYEGIIIRTDGPYALGKRSRYLWKWKNFQDAEFTIVGHKEAQGNDKGTVVWQCSTPEGLFFDVRPRGTRKVRREWFENAEDYYGKNLTVRYQALTKDNVPQFPVGIAIREPGT